MKTLDSLSVFTKQQILHFLNSQDLANILRGETKKDVQDIIHSVENNEYMQALAHIKEAKNKKIKAQNIYLKGAIFDVLNKVEVLLQELASKQAAVDKYNETGDVLFRIDKIVQYLKGKKAYSVLISPVADINGILTYLRTELTDKEKLMVHYESDDLHELFHVLSKYLKRYFYKKLSTISRIRYHKDKALYFFNEVEKTYPHAKKVHDKEKFLTEREKAYISYYPRYLYSLFSNQVLEGIVEGGLKTPEDIIGLFLICIKKYQSIDEKMLVEKFEDELSDDLVRYHQESHVKRELHFIANITPVKRSTEINTQKNSSHKEKKDIPEDVVYFAEMVADNCPEVSQKLVKKYIMRVYDHSKPLSIDHLIGVMGMQQNCREKVESMAKDLGMSLYAKDATTLTSEDEDMSYIKASLGNTYEYQIAKSMQPIPHTSEEIKELFVKAGFMISNEKQLTKQIQEVLIASDADGKMRRKLLFGLQHPAMSWYQKKNKFKTLNIALGYRVVVKTIDKKEYVIGVFHHDDYDLLMPEFNFK